ncbi:MAG: CDP-alcohol phosphatidyltransferase family protein [Bacteroidaceae bacterium]|nr:CDP-alcohol phosphatidyltransferase family protein [Bacteroidaceae bacterium]
MRLKQRVLATMKSRDVESDFELYVTRTPGYLWAMLFQRLHVHPIAVTLMGIVIGAASAIFFYYDDLRLNLIGMLMLIWANWYDCADGQLARMTGQRTLIGRILDGFAGDVWFFFIYLAILLRLWPEWGIGIFLLEAWAGLYCHTRQCALGDYYRNIHLWAVYGREGSELDSSDRQRQKMQSLRWDSKDWFEKLYLFFYTRYTRSQEQQTPAFQRLRPLFEKLPLNDPLREQFRRESLPIMPLSNIITFDTRIIVLFLSLAAGLPWIYFIFEATVLEAVRYYARHRHEAFCHRFYQTLSAA